MMIELMLTVNGTPRAIEVGVATTLLEVLREELLLTGTKEACGVGECGSCMVLMEGEPTPSCLVLAADANRHTIETVEGLAIDGVLDEIQQAFVDAGAFQCGFCTPGMVVTAKALLRDHPDATSDEIKQGLSGVLCRCGSYTKIMKAFEVLTGRST